MDGENYMNKKIIQIMLAILLAFALSGCGKAKVQTVENDKYIELEENKSCCNDLMVEIESYGEYSVIYFYDYTSKSEVYACSQANCTHNVEDYQSGKINCNAIVKGEAKYPFIYNEKLYYICVDTDDSVLWRSNIDGSEKEKVAKLDKPLINIGATFCVYDGKLYIASGVQEEVEYSENSSSCFIVESEVYEISIDSGKIRQLTNMGKKPSVSCDMIQCFEGKVYIKYSFNEKTYNEAGFKDAKSYSDWHTSDDFSMKEDIDRLGKKQNYYVYDLKNNKLDKLDIEFKSTLEEYKGIEDNDCYYIICVKGNKLYYQDPVLANRTIVSYDFNTKEKKEILNAYSIVYKYIDDKIYMVSTYMNENTKDEVIPKADLNISPKYYIYDLNKEELIEQHYGVDGKILYVIDENDEGLLTYEKAFDENYDFIDEHSFYEIQKNSISKK